MIAASMWWIISGHAHLRNAMIHIFSHIAAKSRKSNCVKEVERLKKNREERRFVHMAVL